MRALSPIGRSFFSLVLPFLLGSAALFPLLGQDTPSTLAQDTATGNFGNYQNTPVNSILDTYEMLSGKRLIRDVNLAQAPNISINASGVSKEEMLKLIEANLLLNGVALIPVDDQTMKVIILGQNKSPGSEGVKLYANAADLPKDDQVVSYYMPLSYITPTEAVAIFQVSIPPHPAYGAYVPAPSSQSVVVRDNVSVIRQLIALKELIDVPSAPVTHELIQLTRADAEKTADLLTKMLGVSASGAPGQPGAPGNTPQVPASVGNDAPLANEHNLISGTAQILAVTRSNELLVITRPVNMPFLRELISQLDQPDSFAEPQRYPLKYVLAEDILPALEAAVAQGKDEEDEIKKETTSTGSTTPTQSSTGGGQSQIGGGASGGQGLSPVTSALSAPPENNVPTVVTIGKTRLMADNRSNSIIVFGSPDAITRVSTMIGELDRKPLQVYLRTVIGELTVSAGQEFGIDILQKFQKIGQGGLASTLVTPGTATANASASTATSTSGTTATTTSSSVPEPRSLTSSLGFPLPQGLTLYGAIGSTLNAYVRALETTNRFEVISTPSVYTLNNKLAVIASGSQIPVPATTVSGFSGSSTDLTSSSSITYEGVLLELQIIPLINADHEVTLQIRQTNNTQGSSTVISGNSIPSILTQEINTEVTVPDKATIVIGGLISDNTTRNTSGVPWLSDIPGLGYLFKDTSKSKERDELIIMIQPTVVETEADQIAANETEKQRTILGHEAVEAAAGSVGNTEKTAPLILPQTGANPSVREVTYSSKVVTNSKGTTKTVSQTVTTPAVMVIPSSSHSIVPAASSAAPDVGNGTVPSYPTGNKPPSTAP